MELKDLKRLVKLLLAGEYEIVDISFEQIPLEEKDGFKIHQQGDVVIRLSRIKS